MNKYLWALVILFIEVILETGLHIATSIVRGLSFKNIFVYGLLMVVLWRVFNGKKRYVDKYVRSTNRLILWYLLFCALTLGLTILFPPPQYDWFLGLGRYKSDLLDATVCFFIFYYFADTGLKASKLLDYLVLIVGIAALATLADTLIPAIDWFGVDSDAQRPNGAFGEPNQTAAVFSFTFPLILAKIVGRNNKKIFYMILAIGTLAALATTGSRGGILGTAVGMLIFLWYVKNQLSLGNKVTFMIAAPVIFVMAWLIMPEYYQELLISRFSFLGDGTIDYSEASTGRTDIWAYAFSFWAERPIFGWGWAGYQIVGGHATHSIYMERLTDTGLVGFIIFMVIQFRIWFCLASSRKYARGHAKLTLSAMAAGLIGLYVSLIFVNLYIPALITWSITGVMLSYANQVRIERVLASRNVSAK